jgi:REP element-mobilizing transposase RayT
MARKPRDDAPGAAHHVMVRGIERRAIFDDDRDREDFLRRLSALVPHLGFRCFAWALMPNHVHLVLRSDRVRISQLMARLGTGYARRFNERHDRVGHLFQNRFRSRRAFDDVDLMGLVLYVTRNPLSGGLVGDARELEHFPWCGLGSLMGRRPPRPFEAVTEALALFDPDPGRARQGLRDRLGSGSAPEPVPSAATPGPPPTRVQLDGFEDLVRAVSAAHGLTAEDLRSRRRTPRIAAARAELGAGGRRAGAQRLRDRTSPRPVERGGLADARAPASGPANFLTS